jgi:tetratricopeptide (TPR) repeat protein
VLRRGSSIEERAVIANPSSTQARLDLSFTAMEIGFTLASRQDFTAALSHYDRARTLREAVVRDDPGDARARGQLGITCQRLGLLLIRTGKPEEALPHLTRAAALHRDLFVADPSSVVKQVQAAVAYGDLGFGHQTLAERARSASASSHWRSARTQYVASLDLQRELAARGRDHWLLHRPAHTHPDQLEQRIAACDAALGSTARFNTLQQRRP